MTITDRPLDDPIGGQLERLSARGPTVDPRFAVRRALQLAGSDAARSPEPLADRSRRRVTAVAAAAAIVLVGGVGVVALGDGDQPVELRAASSEVLPPVDEIGGQLLTTPPPAGGRAFVVMPGWSVEGRSELAPATAEPSAACPGCGVDRLVLMGEGPVGVAPILTAWSVTGVDRDRFAAPVTVGGVEGRVTTSPAGTPDASNRTTLAFPLGDEPGARTAIVDARGLSSEQVVRIAAALTWDASVPTTAELPAGFRRVDPPDPGDRLASYLNVSDGRRVLEIFVTSGGVHGMVDWNNAGNFMMWDWEQRFVDGVAIASDAPPADERPILAASATWVAGEWGYTVIGHMFDSEEEFLAAVAALELTDEATFDATTAGVAAVGLPRIATTTGWDGFVEQADS